MTDPQQSPQLAPQLDTPQKVRVWDLPVRVFHWSIVLLIGLSWWSAEESHMEIHQWSGLAVLALVITRIFWGLYGSTTARFSDFLTGPSRMIVYLSAVLQRKLPPMVGHTPTGGWMIVLLLGLLVVQPVLGLFSHDDVFFKGPLAPLVSEHVSDALTELHEALFTILQVAAGLHILAALYYRVILRENIISPMITGWRFWHNGAPRPLRFVSPLWAFVTLLVVAAALYGLILR